MEIDETTNFNPSLLHNYVYLIAYYTINDDIETAKYYLTKNGWIFLYGNYGFYKFYEKIDE